MQVPANHQKMISLDNKSKEPIWSLGRITPASSDSSAAPAIGFDRPRCPVTIPSVIRPPRPRPTWNSISSQCSIADVVTDPPQKPPGRFGIHHKLPIVIVAVPQSSIADLAREGIELIRHNAAQPIRGNGKFLVIEGICHAKQRDQQEHQRRHKLHSSQIIHCEIKNKLRNNFLHEESMRAPPQKPEKKTQLSREGMALESRALSLRH